jgi:hypothetical protein
VGESEETLHDIEALETFGRELRSEIAAVKRDRLRQEQSSTLYGRVCSVVGYGFAAYCAYRVVTAVVNLVMASRRRRGIDPVTRFMGIVLSVFSVSRIDAEFWSQQVSLVFVGSMVFMSMRGFLLNMGKILREYGNRDGREDDPLLAEQRHPAKSRRRKGAHSRLADLLSKVNIQRHFVLAMA